MTIQTNWLAPPRTIGGLDHVGTQGPCILIYSQLLPGITNVTDRARYYSFYPWLIRSYEERDSKQADFESFLAAYRKADCLFTMIAERHAQVSNDDRTLHGPAMVGRETLNEAVRHVGEGRSVRLSTYATRDDSPARYFANRLGGLGQYYAGALTQLDILAMVKKPWLGYTEKRGKDIADAFAGGVDGGAFWRAVDEDAVTGKTLDALSDFCPCRLPRQHAELGKLLDVFFDRKNEFEEEGVQRRRSLALLLDLSLALQAHELPNVDEATFRAAVYTGTLANGSAWTPPEALENTRRAWAYYVRNDVLSVAVQKVFSIALDALAIKTEPAVSIEAVSKEIADHPALAKAFSRFNAKTFGALCESLQTKAPAIGSFAADQHELAWATARVSRERQTLDQEPAFLASVVKLLAILRMRDDLTAPAYGSLVLDPAQLQDSPINLRSFRERCIKWADMPLAVVVEDLVCWTLETHLRVALRKLRQSSTATFRIHPTERGIEARGDIPVPAKTNPRIRQAIRILWDIGALARHPDVSGQLLTTDLGVKLFEAAHA